MNERYQLILYTNASTKAIAGVLIQIQEGIEKPCLFVSHALLEQASKEGIMELELYAFVRHESLHQTYLLGKEFIVRTRSQKLGLFG